MNFHLRSTAERSAFTLIECMIYMSVVFVIIGLGYMAMYRSMDASSGFRRNASDITQALKAGELWREDVRSATGPLRLETVSDGNTVLHVPHAKSEIVYQVSSNLVSRRTGQADWSPVLEHVKTSTFITDPRQHVTAWRWEVELQLYQKQLARVRPLFTFIAVPPNHSAQ